MKRELLAIFSLLILFVANGFSLSNENGEDKTHTTYKVNQTRSFKELDVKLEAFEEEKDAIEYHTDDLFVKPTAADEKIREQIAATFNKVASENRFVKFLDQSTLLELPVGIKSEIGALEYVILIDSVIATPNSTLLYASMQFEAPKIGKVCFRGADIEFSKEGGIVSGGKLELVGDYRITDENAKTQFLLKGTERKTYVEFDCAGFKQFSLDAALIFSNTLVKPEDKKGKLIEGENVTLDFTTTVTNWNDILLSVNIPPFRVNGLDGVSFSVTNAVLDWSDTRNLEGVSYPSAYQKVSPYFLAGTPELWRGVYINSLEVKLPEKFENGDTNRVSFSGNNLIIDNQGFTGLLSAKNLIPIHKGKIGKWNFSLDEISIELVANSIKSGGFNGKIDVPVSSKGAGQSEDKSKLFTYTAKVQSGGDYQFIVSNAEKLEFDLWKANVTLLPSSYVEVKTVEGKFKPKANLNGSMDIAIGLNSEDGKTDGNESKNAKLAKITFENLEIQSSRPYVKVGKFSLGTSSNSLGGFPLSINEIGGGQKDDKIFLDFNVTLSLTGSGGGSFGAEGSFRIQAKDDSNTEDIKYRFDKLLVQGFAVDIDQGESFKLKGRVNFYRGDDIYGNGVSGSIQATFAKIAVEANAIFGSVNGYRYWYADALVDLGTTVQFYPGCFINRFGGGAYYHMKIGDETNGSKLGKTTSGVVYVPDKTVGLGLKAIVGIMAANESLFSAEAVFEMAFNTGGGLRYINFQGKAILISPPIPKNLTDVMEQTQDLASKVQGNKDINSSNDVAKAVLGAENTSGAAVFGAVNINYDFQEKALHANFFLDINVAGGVMTGGGNAVMHFDTHDWYIYIGRPEEENRFKLEILGIAKFDTYFVMGSVVPDTPPPPSNVTDILKDIDLDYMSDLNALEDGAGIGFGASFKVDTGDKSFLIFYGRFQVGAGFDVMLKNYGNTACKGSGQIGMGGWYANGQAYAFFGGKIGVKVKLFGKTKRADILDIAAAVVLQAKLPNPVWMKGVVGGNFSALGGLVKGNCSFEVEIGEECEIINQGSVLEAIDVIADITPSENAADVDVFSAPQVVFNYGMEQEYETLDFDQNVIKFKLALDKVELKGTSGVIATELDWNDDKTVVVMRTSEVLPPQDELSIKVITSFQEFVDGKWEISKVDGEKLTETKTSKFKTGEAPDYIPAHNVAYSYPLMDMLNYYKSESSDGYIKLKQGQAYLFEDNSQDYKVRFTSNTDNKVAKLTYSKGAKEVQYKVPSGLQNQSVYELKAYSVPKVSVSIESNVVATETSLSLGENQDVSVRTNLAEGTIKGDVENGLFATHFRVSKYNSFKEKVASVKPSSGWRYNISPRVHSIRSNTFGDEPFSERELKGSAELAALVQMEADLTNTGWYNQKIYPLIYEGYPLMNGKVKITHRDVSILGIVPKKGVRAYQIPSTFSLEIEDIDSGSKTFAWFGGRFDYDLAVYIYKDFLDLRNKAAQLINSGASNTRLVKLATDYYPVVAKGNYDLNLNYVLPGKTEPTSTYKHKIYNPIDAE